LLILRIKILQRCTCGDLAASLFAVLSHLLSRMGFCDYLGPDFKDKLVDLIKDNFKLLCNNPSEFIKKVIDTMKDKISVKLKASTIPGSGAVRIAMEQTLDIMKTQAGLVAAPLQIALATPPAVAACKAGESEAVMTVLKQAIDTSFTKICGEAAAKAIKEEAAIVNAVSAPVAVPQMQQQMMQQPMMQQPMMQQPMMQQPMMQQPMMQQPMMQPMMQQPMMQQPMMQSMMQQPMMQQPMMQQPMMQSMMQQPMMMPQQQMMQPMPMAAAAGGKRRRYRRKTRKARKSRKSRRTNLKA